MLCMSNIFEHGFEQVTHETMEFINFYPLISLLISLLFKGQLLGKKIIKNNKLQISFATDGIL